MRVAEDLVADESRASPARKRGQNIAREGSTGSVVLVVRMARLSAGGSVVRHDQYLALPALSRYGCKRMLEPLEVQFMLRVVLLDRPVLNPAEVVGQLRIRAYAGLQRAPQNSDVPSCQIDSCPMHERQLALHCRIPLERLERCQAFIPGGAVELVVVGYEQDPVELDTLLPETCRIRVIVTDAADIPREDQDGSGGMDVEVVLDAFEMEVGHELDGALLVLQRIPHAVVRPGLSFSSEWA